MIVIGHASIESPPRAQRDTVARRAGLSHQPSIARTVTRDSAVCFQAAPQPRDQVHTGEPKGDSTVMVNTPSPTDFSLCAHLTLSLSLSVCLCAHHISYLLIVKLCNLALLVL